MAAEQKPATDPAQLRREADKRQIDAMAREAAKSAGVTVAYARKRLIEAFGEGRKI
jgi:hypothetical protein